MNLLNQAKIICKSFRSKWQFIINVTRRERERESEGGGKSGGELVTDTNQASICQVEEIKTNRLYHEKMEPFPNFE